jgi:hypothetical protein
MDPFLEVGNEPGSYFKTTMFEGDGLPDSTINRFPILLKRPQLGIVSLDYNHALSL